MRVGSLFAGIGGFDLGLERAGFEIAWQVEIDPYCQRVLAKHWPNVPRYGDITTVDWDLVDPVNLLCGGFPCQDISLAGKGAGLSGSRSGLWSEYVRAIEALQPAWILIENVSALRSRGLDQVLGALAALGYDATWDCIPASAVGAPHRRDRIWIVAHAESPGTWGHDCWIWPRSSGVSGRQATAVADTASSGLERATGASVQRGSYRFASSGPVSHSDVEPTGWFTESWSECHQWESEPDVGRVAYGIPSRVDRLRGLGNAIVPQIAEWIGRQIIKGGST